MEITPKTKKAMSKDEVSLLVDLIQSNPIIITKETNAATNKLKEESWSSLTNTFNSKSGQIPRQLGQLKLKWDNLKKAARKRAANIRMNNLKTGGGKPDYIPPDDILEKVTSVLGSTCSGFDVPFGGDGVGGTENVILELVNADDWTQFQEQVDTNDASKTKKAMSKDEVSLLVDLIQSNPIIITKETNAATNKLKEESWSSLTTTFNSKSGQIPRQLGQLKLKWDNLKKAARKRAANIRMNNLKTGGGKPDYIPPDDILEKVTSVLGSTCSGFDVPFGGDGVGGTENVILELVNADDWTQFQEQVDTNDASKTKKAMSKDEVSLLVDLIQSNPIIITKETNAATNKLKEESWSSLTNTFNSKSGQIPRQLGQLKLKWDNLKKAARKRAANIRMNNLKTGGGKPDYIPPDDILEKVTSVLGSTCSGFDVPFGGDGVGGTENVILELVNADDWTQFQEQVDTNDASVNILDESLLPLSTTKKRKIDFSPQAGTSVGNTGEQGARHMSKPLQRKAKKLKVNQDDGRLQRNLAIAKYYDKKTEKLDIQIKILKLELGKQF